ncbi:hypothetical protein NL676_035467 [Syzygium grande]|nr:hypothetical protein NL676_035466 [Syzygium grande]KAI6681586.1 hypothetical protein NL676_035467 [Syzygium grande]
MESSPIRRLPASIGMLERLEELNAYSCYQLAAELPTEISGLSSLQKLDITYCNKLQELPKLPSSLNCLLVGSTSLWLVPDLSNLTNLVELHPSNLGQEFAQASSPMQSLPLQWVGKLSKLKKLS